MAENLSEKRPDDYDTAFWLVGRFMFQWALLESELNNGLEKLLGLAALEGTIVVANLQLRSKIHIAKTLIHLCEAETAWGKAAVKDIGSIGDLADEWRNVVAHNIFGPDPNGVKFLTVKAKGKLTFPGTVWTKDQFNEVGLKIGALRKRVEEIVDRASKLLGALREPESKESEKVLQDHLNHLLQAHPGFAPATNEEAPQPPREPEGQ